MLQGFTGKPLTQVLRGYPVLIEFSRKAPVAFKGKRMKSYYMCVISELRNQTVLCFKKEVASS